MPQKIPYNDPRSNCRFVNTAAMPFLATPAAIAMYGTPVIHLCLKRLRELARRHDGLDCLQTFEDPAKPEPLWFIEDGPGGAITALLPSDY